MYKVLPHCHSERIVDLVTAIFNRKLLQSRGVFSLETLHALKITIGEGKASE